MKLNKRWSGLLLFCFLLNSCQGSTTFGGISDTGTVSGSGSVPSGDNASGNGTASTTGGSTSGVSNSGGSSSDGGGATSLGDSATVWVVRAAVSKDGCGDRISDVTQTFHVTISGSSVAVDSSVLTLRGTASDTGFVASFEESTNNCTHDYEVQFSNMSGSSAAVSLSSTQKCGGKNCVNEWSGTATKR